MLLQLFILFSAFFFSLPFRPFSLSVYFSPPLVVFFSFLLLSTFIFVLYFPLCFTLSSCSFSVSSSFLSYPPLLLSSSYCYNSFIPLLFFFLLFFSFISFSSSCSFSVSSSSYPPNLFSLFLLLVPSPLVSILLSLPPSLHPSVLPGSTLALQEAPQGWW